MNAVEQNNDVIQYVRQSEKNKIVLVTPSDFSDVRSIADTLMQGKSVLLNLESIEESASNRMLDFLRGFIYAVDGEMERMSRGLVMIVPNGVAMQGDFLTPLDNQEND